MDASFAKRYLPDIALDIRNVGQNGKHQSVAQRGFSSVAILSRGSANSTPALQRLFRTVLVFVMARFFVTLLRFGAVAFLTFTVLAMPTLAVFTTLFRAFAVGVIREG